MGTSGSKKRNGSFRSSSTSHRFSYKNHRNSYKSTKSDNTDPLSSSITPNNIKTNVKYNSAKFGRKKLFENVDKIHSNDEQLHTELSTESLAGNNVQDNFEHNEGRIENLRQLSDSDPNFLNINATQHSSPKGVFLNETTIETDNSNCTRLNNAEYTIQIVKAFATFNFFFKFN